MSLVWMSVTGILNGNWLKSVSFGTVVTGFGERDRLWSPNYTGLDVKQTGGHP